MEWLLLGGAVYFLSRPRVPVEDPWMIPATDAFRAGLPRDVRQPYTTQFASGGGQGGGGGGAPSPLATLNQEATALLLKKPNPPPKLEASVQALVVEPPPQQRQLEPVRASPLAAERMAAEKLLTTGRLSSSVTAVRPIVKR